MSANARESELQNGATIAELQTHPDPSLHESSDTAIQPAPEPAVDASDDSTNLPESSETAIQPPPSAPHNDSKLAVAEPTGESIQSQSNHPTPVVTAADPKLGRTIQSSNTPELRKDEGSRTFTMRELLDELKNGEPNEDSEAERPDGGTPYSQGSTQQQQQQQQQNNAAMDLINSVIGSDEEGRSRQRILTFAAQRYASAIERNPDDYDALYNWALVLQESADNVSPDYNSPSKDALLEEACKKYDEATRLCPTLHDAYYNWAIAISDRAKMRGRTKEAEELWKQATKNYEQAVQLNWNSPQALNNWGLALQELSAIVPAREKQTIVKTAISKFRSAIQLQYDFHRAIYNLGTVLYGLAEDTSRSGAAVNGNEVSPNELYSQSAIYIAAAHALKPNYSVYTSALKLVRSMLPLPFLKVGYLTAPPARNLVAPHGDWKCSEFVLNHEGLRQINNPEQKHMSRSLSNSGDTGHINRPSIKVDVPDIVSVSACADLTLPPGAGLCIDTVHGPVFLDDIRREAQTMSLIDHPNVITAYCSFVVNRNLWVVMPFMDEGSCLHLMKTAYPDGFEESAIGSFLKETLKALVYLHQHGHIHRDVKAGNILLDSNGVVKLADFGVSACMFDKGDRQRSRNTFVGTPCWMAPEVLQPGSGYDFKADIWSFGITALELAHGHAPFSKYPPMKVLLMTIQNAPPGLDYDRDKRFSKSFKEMVAMCLVKDQTKRPTAEKLLKHSFFKHAKPPELSVKKLFADLPPLWNRVKALQLKDAAQLALKKMPSAEEEAISQSEYQRGVSAWNFDIEDLKVQASLVQDDDELQDSREGGGESMKSYVKDASFGSSLGKLISTSDIIQSEQVSVDEKIGLVKSGSKLDLLPSTSENDTAQSKARTPTGRSRQTQSGPLVAGAVLNHPMPERMRNLERGEFENQQPAEKAHREVRRAPSFSGPLMLPNRASANSLSAPIKPSGGYRDEDKSKANLVQIRGRFSVTSENVDLVKDIPLCTVPRRSSQGSPLRKSASVGDWMFDSKQMPVGQPPKEINNSNLPASILMPHLQNLFQQTSIQQDLIMSLLNSLQPTDVVDASPNGKLPPLPRSTENNGIVEPASSERERLLLIKISELQARMVNLTGELTAEKLKYMQLQQQLNTMNGREENRNTGEGDA